MEETIKEIESGKNGWNTFEVGVKDGNIFIKDESGYIDFPEKIIDRLIDGIDESRIRLREIQRMPTKGEDDE